MLTVVGEVIEKTVAEGENRIRLDINVVNQQGGATCPGHAVGSAAVSTPHELRRQRCPSCSGDFRRRQPFDGTAGFPRPQRRARYARASAEPQRYSLGGRGREDASLRGRWRPCCRDRCGTRGARRWHHARAEMARRPRRFQRLGARPGVGLARLPPPGRVFILLRHEDLHRAGRRALCRGCRAQSLHGRVLRCDPRLLGVALVPLDEPRQALAAIDEALRLGLGAVWIPSRAPGGRSPGHPHHDAIWRRLEETSTPFLLHVGSSSLAIADEWMNDGHSERSSARGRAEVIGSKDLTAIFHSAQRFISVLVLDGVLERFRGLKGGVIELGAGWCQTRCAAWIMPWTFGRAQSRISASSSASPRNRPAPSCASRPTRSRMWARSCASRCRNCTCFVRLPSCRRRARSDRAVFALLGGRERCR